MSSHCVTPPPSSSTLPSPWLYLPLYRDNRLHKTLSCSQFWVADARATVSHHRHGDRGSLLPNHLCEGFDSLPGRVFSPSSCSFPSILKVATQLLLATDRREIHCSNTLGSLFTIVCNAANDVSALLEVKRSLYLPTSNELSASKLLNPKAIFRSASSRSASSRFLMNSSSTIEEGNDNTNDLREEHCMMSGSHHSTLDRLNTWEKKLFEEVKMGCCIW